MRLPFQGPTTPNKVPLDPLQSQTHAPWHLKQGHTVDRHAGQSAPDQGHSTPLGDILPFPKRKPLPQPFLNSIPSCHLLENEHPKEDPNKKKGAG